jgi:hypothetical protein
LSLALSIAAVFAAAAFSFGESAIPLKPGLAADCRAGASLSSARNGVVNWVVWCGPARGRFRIEIKAPKGSRIVSWGSTPRVKGGGATSQPACRLKGVGHETCALRKSGPITVRGSFRPDGRPCDGVFAIGIRTDAYIQGEGFYGHPWGCPGSRPPRAPTLTHILNFHVNEALGAGLRGDRSDLRKEARSLRRAWIDEAPVERWSAVAWGAPVDAAEAEELALRSRSIEQAGELIDRWVHDHHAGSTYAGWTWGREGTIYVGFTEEPDATVAQMKDELRFIAPDRVEPFPTPPTHSESELWNLSEAVVEYLQSFPGSWTNAGVDVLANKAEIGAQKVARTRRLVIEHFGAQAPIEVVKGYPAVALRSR